MPPAAVVQASNPKHLSDNAFLVNLAVSFHVTSIPLAIFVFILVLIACVLFIAVVILIVRKCLRQSLVKKNRKKGMKSVYLDEIPGANPTDEKSAFGRFEYSLEYNMDRNLLTVGTIQATNLKTAPGVDKLDPYVLITVKRVSGSSSELVDKPQRTMVCKQTSHPTWHKTFTYNIPESELGNIIIKFDVYDYDSLAQDEAVGQLIVPLKTIDQADYAGKIFEKYDWLKDGEPVVEGIGRMCVGLGFYPQFNRIDVTIYECQNLSIDIDPSHRAKAALTVHCELRRKKRKLTSNETKSKTELVNPYYNEKMSFPVKHDQLDDYWVALHLRLSGKLLSKRIVGSTTLGYASVISTGVKHWEEMLKGPGKVHVMWHAVVEDE